MDSAVFPASKSDVLAVTGANHDGSEPNNVYNYGNKAGVVAFTNLATTGLRTTDIVTLGGSSGATGIVGGIAALVRAHTPTWSAADAMNHIISTSGSGCGAPHAWREAMVNASAAAGGPCVYYLLGPATVVTTQTSAADGAVWQLVLKHAVSGFQFGGSGSYRVDWTFGMGATPTDLQEGDVTDASGNTYFRSYRHVAYQAASDGYPYIVDILADVYDNQLGTVDHRKITVEVCVTTSNCAPTTRTFPLNPSVHLDSVSISGPSSVQPFATCSWSGSASGGTAPYTYQWTAPGATGTGEYFDYTNGVLDGGSFTLSLSAWDDNGVSGSYSKTISVRSSAPPCAY